MKKHKITEQDYLKAHRRASREEEIALYGKPVRLRAVHKSKKAYDRKREKAGLRNLPFSFLLRGVSSASVLLARSDCGDLCVWPKRRFTGISGN